jgi:hypothetical protein
MSGGFPATQPAPVFGQQNFVAPAVADPYGMPGYGPANYGQANYGQPGFGQPGYGQPQLDYGAPVGGALGSGGGDIAASTTVKALIGVAIGVVVLLVGAIIGEKMYAARQNAPRPVAAAPASDPSKPVPSVPAPVGSFVPKPAPKPEPAATPVSIPANGAAPPGMQAYSVPGKFTIFAPASYSWRAQPEQALGRGITASAFIGTAPDNSALTVSIISSPIKAQKDRRDFLRGASGGMTRGAAGMTLVDSQGFNPTGTVPDHLDVQITMQGINGVSVHGKGFIKFGKKRTSMVMVMAQDIAIRDSMMTAVNSFKEL